MATFLHTIYTSTNSGITWMSNTVPPAVWNSVASSPDGFLLVASGSGAVGGVYVSTNGGATWAIPPGANGLLPGGQIVVSANGDIMFAANAAVTDNLFFISTNAGATWTSKSIPFGAIAALASSADAKKLVAVGGADSLIFTSTNSGDTWVSNNVPSEPWSSVATSADGKTLAAVWQGCIYTSTNYGGAWSPANVPFFHWNSVVSSADGTKLVAVGYNRFTGGSDEPIYVSTNSGATWTSNASLGGLSFAYLASSADGNKLVAADQGGAIYTSFTIPEPQLNLVPTNGNLALSWIVPSTNFVLQQNPDLTTENWTDVTNEPVLNLTNLQDEVKLPLPASNCFYRLATQ
ncbi:MAG TPA: hypothetical protein VMA13_04120 [Candidatus Saccharimonadales bacterium]|nr:hypothetical protein [Candidatus Saccharimonadales bacterium]